MKRLFPWLSTCGQQPTTVDVGAEMRGFNREIRELQHLFELQIAGQASEAPLRECHADLEQIRDLMIAWQEREVRRQTREAAQNLHSARSVLPDAASMRRGRPKPQ